MSDKNKKLFGVWMDNHDAIIVGNQENENGDFTVVGHIKNGGADNNSNENTANNQENTLRQKFFREIALKMPNIDEIHLSGTGQAQEQFTKFLAETPQYKNVKSSASTSNKMSDENLISFMTTHFN